MANPSNRGRGRKTTTSRRSISKSTSRQLDAYLSAREVIRQIRQAAAQGRPRPVSSSPSVVR